jgi:hypothetical protein
VRLLAAALVTTAVVACDLASDVLTMSDNAVVHWHIVAITALVGFAWLVHRDVRGERERECDCRTPDPGGGS